MHHTPAQTGRGQAAGLPGAVWERVFVPEMRICAGAAAGVCEAAQGVLSGVQGTLCQHRAVYDQGSGWAGLP